MPTVNVKKLQFIYFIANGLVLLAIVILYFWEDKLGLPLDFSWKAMPVVILFLSFAAAFIIPMWIRILMFNKRPVSKERLSVFETVIILSASFAFAMAAVAYVFKINTVIRAAIVLSGFFALYMSYPSEKKINFDIKTFVNVSPEASKNIQQY